MIGVILAGGLGKRLRPLTSNVPKPMVSIAGKPILVRQIEWLKNYGVRDFIFCVGYLKEKIIEYVGNGRKFEVNVRYSVEERSLGTGGALKNAEDFLKNETYFFVLNGDIITNLNPLKLLDELKEDVAGVIAVVPLTSPYGIVDIDGNRAVRGFREKPVLDEYLINAGVYCLKSSILKYLPVKGGIEVTAFPKLAQEGRLKAVKYGDVFWKSIDTHKDVDETERALKSV
jgi:NDP-sugar pyrophosphorylase family protein